MKTLKSHRVLSFVLALCMLCTMLSGLSLTAFADTFYLVTYSVPAGFTAPAAANVHAGDSYTLPVLTEAPEGYTFAGWYATPIDSEVTSVPSLLSGNYTPTASITLFACYKRTETIPGYFQKTIGEPPYGDPGEGKDYLFVCAEKHNNNYIAFNAAKSTLYSSGNYISVAIVGDKIALTTEAENAAVRIAKDVNENGFYMYLPQANKYMGSPGSKAGITTSATPILSSITFSGQYATISATANQDYKFYYNKADASDRFGFYKQNNSNIYLYEKQEERTVVYYTTFTACDHQNTTLTGYVAATCTEVGHTGTLTCDDCHATLQVDSEIPALGHNYGAWSSNDNGTHSKTCSRCNDVVTEACNTSGANGACSVCGYISQGGCNHSFVNNGTYYECSACHELFRIRSATLSLGNQIDVAYICDIPSGFTDAVLTVNGTEITEYRESNGKFYFFYTGVNPQCMGDNLSATLTAAYKGTTYTVTKGTYSVREYCANRLNSSTTSDELRALVTALLRYGAYAQYYMGYNTNAYVTAGNDLSNPVVTAFTELSGYSASFVGNASDETFWISAGLTLTNGVAMTFRFYAEDTSGLSVTVQMNGKEQIFTEDDFTSIDTNVYEISFAGIYADEYAETVTAYFERDENQEGNTLSYSVNAYIQAKQNDTNNKLKLLVRALSVYGVCVEAYKASMTN